MRTPASYSDRVQLLIDARHGIGDPGLIKSVTDRDTVIAEINQWARRRRYAIKLQQKIDRAMESYVRIYYTKWEPNASDAERAKFNKEVAVLITKARAVIAEAKVFEDGKDLQAAANVMMQSDLPRELLAIVKLTDNSRAPADEIRQGAEQQMAQFVKQLPVAKWIESVRGIGLPGLALIVSEAAALNEATGRVVGLDGYPNPAKLWKRLGYAPYDGFAGSTWKREKWRPRKLTAEEWMAYPFSGERYAPMSQLATHLVDHQWIGKNKTDDGEGKPNGPYGEVYYKRRKHCEMTHPDWTDDHRRKDALRVAFKQFLVDLWKAWIDSAFDLGQKAVDAQDRHAEIAVVGQPGIDARTTHADGGTSSKKSRRGHVPADAPSPRAATDDLGQHSDDTHQAVAGIAATDRHQLDARAHDADGGTLSKKRRGHRHADAQGRAAATSTGHNRGETQVQSAGAHKRRGRSRLDAQSKNAATAAAGQRSTETRSRRASGGSKSRPALR